MALYDADGNIRVTVADANARGLYAPDGSYYVNVDSTNKGLYGPNGALNVKTWYGETSLYNPDGGMYVAGGTLVTAATFSKDLYKELVVNGSFDTDLSGWSVATSTPPGTMVWDAGRALLVNSDGTGVARLTQAVPTEAGKTYRFTYTSITMTTRLGTTEGGSDIKALNTQGRHNAAPFEFVAPSTVCWIGTVDGTAGRWVDDFSIRRIV